MPVAEERPEIGTQLVPRPEVWVERKDISFQDVEGGNVRIQVKVHNAGTQRSRATSVCLASAPFGAFVPWTPLGVLPVPPLAPGETLTLSMDVARPRPAPLGDFGGVPPRRLLTAVNAPEAGAPRARGGSPGMIAVVQALASFRAGSGSPTKTRPALPPDLLELLGRDNPHWAGNINVFIGGHSVERHRAGALRVHAGRTNMAMFLVGDPARPGAYAFELVGLEAGWEAGLYDVTNNQTLVVGPADAPLPEARWVETKGGLMVMLVIRPPAGCRRGNLEVRVTRRSGGKAAVVEFDLDPNAQGAGCYYV